MRDQTDIYLHHGDPESSARPHSLIGPDLVSELDILDCNVVPAEANIRQENQQNLSSNLSERPANVSPSKTWCSRNEVQQELPEEQVP